MPVSECLQRVSHREYLAWDAYLFDDLNRPDKLEYYMMRVAQRVVQTQFQSKDWDKIELEQQRIKFVESGKEKPLQLSEEEKLARATAASKAAWSSRGIRPIKRVR